MTSDSHHMRCWTDLEELDANDGEHELEQERHQHDVVNGFNGNNHTLHDMLRIQTNKVTPQLLTADKSLVNRVWRTRDDSICTNT